MFGGFKHPLTRYLDVSGISIATINFRITTSIPCRITLPIPCSSQWKRFQLSVPGTWRWETSGFGYRFRTPNLGWHMVVLHTLDFGESSLALNWCLGYGQIWSIQHLRVFFNDKLWAQTTGVRLDSSRCIFVAFHVHLDSSSRRNWILSIGFFERVGAYRRSTVEILTNSTTTGTY